MSANSRFTVAVHALCWLELARRDGRPSLTSAEVADSLAAHPVLVRRILGPLRDAGLVEPTGRGPGAGWRLADPAAAIGLDRVHTALGREPAFALHAHEPKPTCPVGHGIRPVLEEVYDDVAAAIAVALRRRTVADVLDQLLTDHPLHAVPSRRQHARTSSS